MSGPARRARASRIVPLWESDALTGVYGVEWNQAEEAAAANLSLVVRELDRTWGAHRRVSMHVPLFRNQAGEPMPALFQALVRHGLLRLA